MGTADASLPPVVVFGEALTDLIRQDDGRHWLARPGGAPWNVARVVARLGVPAAFAGAVGRDVFGDELAAQSAEAGLDLRFLQRSDHAPLLAVVPSTEPPRYFFIGDDSADLHFDPRALPAGWREAARVVHFGSISLARVPLAGRLVAEAERCRIVHDLRRSGVKHLIETPGNAPHTVMAFSGHSTPSTLRRYHIIDLDVMRHAAERASARRSDPGTVTPLRDRPTSVLPR
jgi:hypothetical protein